MFLGTRWDPFIYVQDVMHADVVHWWGICDSVFIKNQGIDLLRRGGGCTSSTTPTVLMANTSQVLILFS
jgi:hypothetical protein